MAGADGVVYVGAGTSWIPTQATPYGLVTDLSCPTEDTCFAISDRDVYRWSEGGWSLEHQDPEQLSHLSCPATSFCTATDYGGQGLVVFDGSTWQQFAQAGGGNGFSALSCSSPTFCVAADGVGTAVEWHGSDWSTPAPIRDGAVAGPLDCPTDGVCTALLGGSDAVRLTGGAWSAPETVSPVQGEPVDIACPEVDFCVAVDKRLAAVTLRDGVWERPVTTQTEVPAYLPTAVSCATRTSCTGVTGPTPTMNGNVLGYDGQAWSQTFGDHVYADVSCVSATWCLLVRSWGATRVWDGSTATNAPRIGTPDGWAISSAECVSPTFCAAVDRKGRVSVFDGSAWTPMVATDPTLSEGRRAISCATETFCVVVDQLGRASRYDGSGWSSLVTVDGAGGGLQAVDCPGTELCTAVDAKGRALDLVDGAWTAPVLVDPAGDLTSVSCATSRFCVAISTSGTATVRRG